MSESVTVTVRHADTGDELQVVVPDAITFKELKVAIADKVANPDVAKKGRLMTYAEGGSGYKALRDTDKLASLRLVLLKNVDLGVGMASPAAPAASGPTPILACFYSGGMTVQQGCDYFAGFLAVAAAAGIEDSIVLGYPTEKEYAGCEDSGAYSAKMLDLIDADPKRRGRPVLVLAHSHGSIFSYFLARHLGGRVLKLYVVCCRPPHLSTIKDVWNVNNEEELSKFDDHAILQGLIGAWRNDFLAAFKDLQDLPPPAKAVVTLVRQQYSGTKVAEEIVGNPGPPISTPIFAVASRQEMPKGETAMKMESWRELTSGRFKLLCVEEGHFECLKADKDGKCALFSVLLSDMKSFIP